MKQVYVVIETYYEDMDDGEDIYNCEHIKKIFDSEDKAVSYIKDAFVKEHNAALASYSDEKSLKLYDSSTYYFQAGNPVRVLDIWKDYGFSLAIHYRYDIYDVE